MGGPWSALSSHATSPSDLQNRLTALRIHNKNQCSIIASEHVCTKCVATSTVLFGAKEGTPTSIEAAFRALRSSVRPRGCPRMVLW